jgi:hypothetical protein
MAGTAHWNSAWKDLAKRGRSNALSAVMDPAAVGARKIVTDARAAWPVLTGRSRRGLSVAVVRLADKSQSVYIVNPVWYTLAVHAGDSWRQLILVPWGALLQDLRARAGARLAAAVAVR